MIQLEKPTVVIRHSRYPEEEKKKTSEAPSLAGTNLFINGLLKDSNIKLKNTVLKSLNTLPKSPDKTSKGVIFPESSTTEKHQISSFH